MALYPLDEFTTAKAAYSTRRLRTGQFYCMQIERADGQTRDISFYGNTHIARTDHIKQFCDADTGGSGSTGTVRIWYDQTGNGNDATQTDRAYQPLIYDGSSVVESNGITVLDPEGRSVLTTGLALSQPFSSYVVANAESDANGYITCQYVGNAGIFQASTSRVYLYSGQHLQQSSAAPSRAIYRNVYNGANSSCHINSELAVSGNAGTFNVGNMALFGQSETVNSVKSTNPVQEIIFFEEDHSSNIDFENRINNWWSVYAATPVGTGVFSSNPLPLDIYDGATMALSVCRKLRSGYSGPCLRVRRDNDDSELDIGFDASGNLDVSAIADHCGSSNGYVNRIYDQLGLGRHAHNDDSNSYHPKIYDGTSGIYEVSGRPTLEFDGIDDRLIFPHVAKPTNLSALSVFSVQGFTTGFGVWLNSGSQTRMYMPYTTGGISYFGYGNVTNAVNLGPATTDLRVLTFIAGPTQGNAQAFVDGVSKGSRPLSYESNIRTEPVGIGTYGQIPTGYFQELMIFNDDQSGNRLGLEKRITDYYRPAEAEEDDSATPAAVAPLLTDGRTATMAISVRKLRAGYTGACMRVRRGSDNSEQDIDFDATGRLDTDAIESFCGNSIGYVSKWYNQGTDSLSSDAEQIVWSKQPQIYDGSTIYRSDNDEPAVQWKEDGVTGENELYFQTGTATSSVALVQKTSDSQFILLSSPTKAQRYLVNATNGHGSTSFSRFDDDFNDVFVYVDVLGSTEQDTFQNGTNTRGQVHTALADGRQNFSFWHNMNDVPADAFVLGDYQHNAANDYSYEGLISELIFFTEDYVTSRETIEDNINSYYNITTTQLLDKYRNATVACSVRRLRRDDVYVGPCMQVERLSDNATLDIGFDSNGTLDKNLIKEFCDAGNGGESAAGVVRIWYDQTGNGNHLTQSDSSRYYYIYDGTSVYTDVGGRPQLQSTSNAARLYSPAISITPPATILYVKRGEAGRFSVPLWGTTQSTPELIRDMPSQAIIGAGGGHGIVPARSPNKSPDNAIFTMLYGANSSTRVNNNIVGFTQDNVTSNITLLSLGGRYNNNEGGSDSEVQELVVWPEDQFTVNNANIETNSNNYFQIFGDAGQEDGGGIEESVQTTLNLGLNTGTFGYFQPNTPFKDLIKNSPFPWRDNVTLSGVTYRRLYYVPPGFPNEVSGQVGNDINIYISASSTQDGFPASLAYGSTMLYAAQEFPVGGMSAICPPSSIDDPNAAVFHLMYDGQGAGGAFPFRIRYAENNGSLTDADRVEVSAGEYKVSGMDTRTITSFWIQTISIDEEDAPRNIRLVHQDYRDNFEAEPFFPEMVNYYKSMTNAGGPVRNMKWARTNESQFGILSSVHGDSFDQSATLTTTGSPQGNNIGMSYAYQAQFANAIERDLWVNIHYKADDATVSAIASTIQAELNSNRKVYVELGNEWWNTSFPYNTQRYYFTEQAEANGGSGVYDLPGWNDGTPGYPDDYEMGQAYGVQRSIDIFNIFAKYFSSERVVNVLAAQLAQRERNKAMLLFSGAYLSVDALAVNPYVGNILGNSTAAATAVESEAWTSDDLYAFMYSGVSATARIPVGTTESEPLRISVSETYDMLQASSEFENIDLIGYEGGHHLNVAASITGSARTYLIDLIGSTKYDSRWDEWNQYLCSSLYDYGMVTHTHFVDISNWSADDTTRDWEWFGVIPFHGVQTPTRTGLEAYAALATRTPTPNPEGPGDPGPIPTARVRSYNYPNYAVSPSPGIFVRERIRNTLL